MNTNPNTYRAAAVLVRRWGEVALQADVVLP